MVKQNLIGGPLEGFPKTRNAYLGDCLGATRENGHKLSTQSLAHLFSNFGTYFLPFEQEAVIKQTVWVTQFVFHFDAVRQC